jgi:hypothetical protein
MAADMLLGDEQRWHSLTPTGTASFFKSDSPRMLVLARLELDDSMRSCCFMDTNATCHDAFIFRSPLHAGVRLDLFNFQQNVWQAENYAVGLLRRGGYQLFNPCFDLPLFHNHMSDLRPNQNENRCITRCVSYNTSHSAVPTLPPPPVASDTSTRISLRFVCRRLAWMRSAWRCATTETRKWEADGQG